MEKFFVYDGKKHVLVREFKKMNDRDIYQRVDVFDNYGKMISCSYYSQKQIDDLLKKAAKGKK